MGEELGRPMRMKLERGHLRQQRLHKRRIHGSGFMMIQSTMDGNTQHADWTIHVFVQETIPILSKRRPVVTFSSYLSTICLQMNMTTSEWQHCNHCLLFQERLCRRRRPTSATTRQLINHSLTLEVIERLLLNS